MSTPLDPPAQASPAVSRAASAGPGPEPGPDGTAAPAPRPVMGRPRQAPKVAAADEPSPSRSDPGVPDPLRPGPAELDLDRPIPAEPAPVDLDPAATDPAGVHPAGAASAGVDPPGVDPAGAAPDGAATTGAAPDGAAPDGAAPDGAAPDGAAPVGAASTGPAGTGSFAGIGSAVDHSADDRSADDTGGRAETAVGEPVRRPDQDARRAAVARVSELALPVGGLGSVAELGCWLAACQGESPPRPPVRARVLLVAADHGVAEAGVSAYAPGTGRARAVAAADGRLPVAVAARAAGASVRVVDVGLREAVGPDEENVVTRDTGRIDRADALTEEQVERAYRIGQLLADAEIDAGADVLVPGSLAVAATTPAAVLVAALTGAEPVAVVGRGSGIDDRAWMRKATAIRDALRRGRPYVRTPLELLRRVGGPDIVVLAGFLARAADRRVPVVLDGVAVGAAALLAEELAPGAREWWLAAQASSEPAMTLVLEHLSLAPVLDLGVRTDDGTAAVTVLPLLVTAARLIAETGTAADTGIAPLDAV